MKLDRTPWLTVSVIIVSIMALPLLPVLSSFAVPATDTWAHIRDYLLLDYLRNSLVLVATTVTAGIVLASALAWVVTAYDFPGRRFLAVALVLPLAIPPYVGGYTYAAMVGYTGVIQVFCREVLDWKPPPGLFDLQNMGGAIFIFTLFLYPYIYLVVRGFLDRHANQLIEASVMLGASHLRTYWRVVVPLTRNAVIAGATLMAFEVLSDYGLASYFGIKVFTTAVFTSWLGYRDMNSALRLAAILLLVVTVLSVGEKALRGARSHSYAGTTVTPLRRRRLRGWPLAAVLLLCWTVLALGLLIPLAQMIYWAVLSLPNIRLDGLFEAFFTSLWLGLAAATLTTVCALIVAQHQRLWPSRLSRLLARLTVMGYSVPSTVIALSVLSIVVWLSQKTGWNLLSTPAVVVVAYAIRYLAVSMQSVESGLERVNLRLHESSRLLGRGPLATTVRIDIPLLKTALVGGFLLAFMDMVKELPLVLIVRPFNLSTLSTRVFEYAYDEKIPESSLASLLIVILALIPIITVLLFQSKEQSVESPHE
ncbi:MAG: iron ABC transporter permease [Actinomycetaceae bacterium]|nr:iron ABC transporter permease [Actinomycetaceae bacterium]